MHAINRVELLQKLDAVQPGISVREITDQSSCFVFKDGNVCTYNEDIACRIKSGLPKDAVGAVVAKPLREALNKMKSVMVDVDLTADRFIVKDKRGGTTRVILEAKIKLLIDEVEKPVKDKWVPVPPGFGDAIAMVQECASRDDSDTVLSCIHLHPKFIEACDNVQMSRYRLNTGLTKPILVKRDSIKHVVSMDMTRFNESEKWIHFRNEIGLTLSCLRFATPYPHEQITALYQNFKGRTCNLPKGLDQVTELAQIFSREDPDEDQINIELMPGKMKIVGVGNSGDHTGYRKCTYSGPKMEFRIGPKLLTEITKKHTEAKFSKEHLTVESKRWRYLTALTAPSNGKPKEESNEGEE